MENNNWTLIFRPNNIGAIIVVSFLLLIIIAFSVAYSNKTISIILVILLVFVVIILVLESKKAYFEIQETGLMVWSLDIPNFRTIEKYVQYSDIEYVIICDSMTSNYGNQIQIKIKDQKKKIVTPWVPDKVLDEIKENLIKKWLQVSICKQVSVFPTRKRKTEHFNKNV
jgi:hypothetical protein